MDITAGEHVLVMTPEDKVGYEGTFVGVRIDEDNGNVYPLIKPDDPALEDPMVANPMAVQPGVRREAISDAVRAAISDPDAVVVVRDHHTWFAEKFDGDWYVDGPDISIHIHRDSPFDDPVS